MESGGTFDRPHLLGPGHHVDVVLQQRVQVRHVQTVELGNVREDEQGGPGLGEAARQVDPFLSDQVLAVLQMNLLRLLLFRSGSAGAATGRSLSGLRQAAVCNDFNC